MRGKSVVLGLMLLAAMALSGGVAASAMAAEEHEFRSKKEKTVFKADSHAETTQDFELENGLKYECDHLHAEGTMSGETETNGNWTTDALTLGVELFGTGGEGRCDYSTQPGSVTVDDDGCHLQLDSDTTTGNPTGGEHANVTLTCPEGGLTMTGVLDIEIPNQTIEHAVHYDNTGEGSTHDFTITVTAHGIEWSCLNTVFVCTIGADAVEGDEATYLGGITAKGFVDEGGSTETGYNAGAQVGVWVE